MGAEGEGIIRRDQNTANSRLSGRLTAGQRPFSEQISKVSSLKFGLVGAKLYGWPTKLMLWTHQICNLILHSDSHKVPYHTIFSDQRATTVCNRPLVIGSLEHLSSQINFLTQCHHIMMSWSSLKPPKCIWGFN